MELRAERLGWADAINIYAFQRNRDHTGTLWKLVPGEPMAEGDAFVEPSIRLSTQQAQELIDQLWSAGLRPSEGSGSAGALAATERHLKDMQRLVFARLEAEK